jgi:hypothetical protein
LLFTTFTSVFEGQYSFITATSGLVYLSLEIAIVVAMPIFNTLNVYIMIKAKAKGLLALRPEERLLHIIWFSPYVAVGLFIYS